MNDVWRFVDVEEHSGSYHMLLDEQMARALLNARGYPTVRVYRWQPWAISLGFNQDIAQIDAARANADGIDVVRRPTGGRAVLHAEELTYSVVMDAQGMTVLEVYNAISKALLRGLRLFGVDAGLSKAQPDFREHYKAPSSVPCFTASARYEIGWKGRKLVGSAQRRFREPQGGRDVVLQHGSILLGPAHKRLVDYLVLNDESSRDLLKKELDRRTIDLSSLKNTRIEVDELAACLRRGFEEEWRIRFVEQEHFDTRMVIHG